MRLWNALRSVGEGLRRLLHIAARPSMVGTDGHGIVVQAFRGYGTQREVFLMGRVSSQPGFGHSVEKGTLRRALVDFLRRLLQRGLDDARIVARFAGAEQQVATDRDGYFRVHMRDLRIEERNTLWHRVDLALIKPAATGITVEGWLFVPPAGARFVVISDIDDTVMYTGVASKLAMLWRLFFEGARSRVAFPGVAAFYRALHAGVSATELNPMLYVSRAPWSLYPVLEEFFGVHRIPVGPVLFLREWGLTLQSPLPRRARGHKLALIREMLALYSELPFVLIGDSGQHDPEIYEQVLRENPGRVLAIYIRNVSRDAERGRAIETLALKVVDARGSLLLAADSFAMAEHAAKKGLISPGALAEVFEERERQPGAGAPQPVRRVSEPSRGETRDAIEQGQISEALAPAGGNGSPSNVVIEAEDGRDRRAVDQTGGRTPAGADPPAT